MREAIWLILAILFAVAAGVLGASLNARARDLRKALARLKAAEKRLESAELELKARHEPEGARQEGAGAADERLTAALAEVARLETVVARSEGELAAERARSAKAAKSGKGAPAANATPDADLVAALERAEKDLQLSAQRAQRFEEEAVRLREEVARLREELGRVESEAAERVRRQQQVAEQRVAGVRKPQPEAPAAAAVEPPAVARPAAASRAARAARAATTSTGTTSTAAATIVVIEGGTGASLGASLEKAGYRVVKWSGKEDAVALVRDTRPAVILLDSQLSGADGWELLKKLKNDSGTREVPVILIAPAKERERALDMGAAQVFGRPLDSTVVLGAIRSALLARKNRERRSAAAARVAAMTSSPGVPLEQALTNRKPEPVSSASG
mgnify:CR=1 FL=1|jgi:Response regulators consisting of a CheY-like receiver domain and a winged-helix DNA-binding domain